MTTINISLQNFDLFNFDFSVNSTYFQQTQSIYFYLTICIYSTFFFFWCFHFHSFLHVQIRHIFNKHNQYISLNNLDVFNFDLIHICMFKFSIFSINTINIFYLTIFIILYVSKSKFNHFSIITIINPIHLFTISEYNHWMMSLLYYYKFFFAHVLHNIFEVFTWLSFICE